LRGESADFVNDALLSVGRDGRLRLFHREDDVLLVLRDLCQHREHQQVDCPGTLPIERRGVLPFTSGNEGSDYVPQTFTRKVRDFEMRCNAPLPRDILLDRRLDAFQNARYAECWVTCDGELTQLANGLFPHLRPDLFDPQDDVEKASVFETQRSPGRTQ